MWFSTERTFIHWAAWKQRWTKPAKRLCVSKLIETLLNNGCGRAGFVWLSWATGLNQIGPSLDARCAESACARARNSLAFSKLTWLPSEALSCFHRWQRLFCSASRAAASPRRLTELTSTRVPFVGVPFPCPDSIIMKVAGTGAKVTFLLWGLVWGSAGESFNVRCRVYVCVCV